MSKFEEFVEGYLDAVVFTENEEGVLEFDRDDLTDGFVAVAKAECRAFAEAAWVLLADAVRVEGYDAHQAGIDFWLTRNGHGAGFWDGDLPEALGEELTQLAHGFSMKEIYEGDDEEIYFY
jgi:hypothetical protein